MSDHWFYAKDGQQYGPVPMSELKQLASTGALQPNDYLWCEGMTNWAPAHQVTGIFENTTTPPPMPPPSPWVGTMSRSDVASRKITAGVLALVLGSLGVHKFVLGMTGPGIIMLVLTVLSCGLLGTVMWAIGICEGIIYLSKSEDDFYRDYVLNKRQWF